MKQPPDKPLPYYRAIKQSLRNILKHPEHQDVILETVMSAHRIVIHTLQFLKLYLLHHYDRTSALLMVDEVLILNIMKVLCEESIVQEGADAVVKKQGRPPKAETVALKTALLAFHREHYKPTMTHGEALSYKNMNTVLSYLTTDLLTVFETNIKQHYVEYVERFINVVFMKKEKCASMSKEDKASFTASLRKIKNQLLNGEACPELQDHIAHICPSRKFQKDNLYYDLQCSPRDYLPCMLYMMRWAEAQGQTIYNVFPLRTDIIPKYIRLDTTTIVQLFITSQNRSRYGTKDELLTKGNLVRRQADIWSFFFRTEKKCFATQPNNPYQFNFMIETDGVACSILWVRKDMVGKRFKPKLTPSKEVYIDEVEAFQLQGKTIVGIDPNKSDLIFCSTKREDESIKTFRYTQDQKRKETKDKKYRNLRDELKTTMKVDGKTPQEWETELSNFNRKSLQQDVFKQYLTKKNEVNSKLLSFYEGQIFRKLKWNAFMNRKRSEHKMLHRFRSIFGTPEEVVIGFGDWEQRKQMRFKEPTKGKGMRELFRKAGYKVYLVDEFRTSCRCHKCEGECTTFRECPNPRPWKKNETTLRHGLLMCKTCTGLWNRDVNSSLNIHRVVEHHMEGKGRPKYLSRQFVSATTSVVQNQILHEDAKPQHWNGEMCA
jgi:hypothetical protein